MPVRKRSMRAGSGRRLPKRDEPLSVRVDADTKKTLRADADRLGVTLSRVVEERLLRSVDADEALKRRFGDPATRSLSELVAHIAALVTHYKPASWRDDPWTFQEFKAGVIELVSDLGPAGPVVPPKDVAGDADLSRPGSVGRTFAKSILRMLWDIGGPTPSVAGYDDWQRRYRDLGLEEKTR